MEFAGTSNQALRTTDYQDHQKLWGRSEEKSLVPGVSLDNSMGLSMQMEQPEDPSAHATEVDILEAEIEDLEAQLQSERKSKDALCREVASSSDEIERLVREHEARLNEVESKLFECQRALDNVTHELATAKENLKAKEDALNDVEHDLFHSKEEVNGLRDELEKQEAQSLERAQEYESKLQKAEQKLHRVERQHQESAAQLSAFQAQMNARMEVDTNAHRDEIDRMSTQIQDHLHNIAQLEETHRQAELHYDEGTRRIEHLSREQEKLKQENRRLTGVISEMIQNVQRTATSDAEVQRLQEQIGALQRKHQTELCKKEDQIDRLYEKLQDRSLDQLLDNSLTKQMGELHSDMSRLRMDNRSLNEKSAQMMQEKIALSECVLELNQKVSDLNREKSDLRMKITTLEKVRPADGVVICIDLSASLGVTLVKIAKDAFRTITSGIRARNPKTHLGVIVQESSIWTARNLSPIDAAADGLIDVSRGGGSECYETAIPSIELMMSSFWTSYPRRATRVILIGDGQAVYGYPLHLLEPFQAHDTPIHNVVVQNKTILASSASSSQTAEIANRTKGLHFGYSGDSTTLLNDALLGRKSVR